MHGIDAGFAAGGNHLIDIKIITSRPLTQPNRLIRNPDMQSIIIWSLIYCDSYITELLDGANDTQGDFTSVRN